MAKISDKQAFDLIRRYYNDESTKVSTINTFISLLEGAIADEIKLARVILTPKEIESEASYALIFTFHEVVEKGDAEGWELAFLARFRNGLKASRLRRKHHVDISEIAIEDPSPNPEELYITKELVHLIRVYLHNHFDLLACDWFMRRFAEGESSESIAHLYGVGTRAVNKRLCQMMPRVKRYMEKING